MGGYADIDFCVQKSLVFDEKILEDYTYEIRI